MTNGYIDNAEEILEGAKIFDVIKDVAPEVDLRKSGSVYKANCPFHSEKNPSFTVDLNKNNFCCYGCGKRGDAAKFLEYYKNIPFPAQLEQLAKTSRITVKYNSNISEEDRQAKREKADREQQKKESLSAYFKLVVDHYFSNIDAFETKEVDGVTRYNVAGRWYTAETVEKFKLCPPTGNGFVLDHAKKNKWELKTLQQIGVLNANSKGNLYDSFVHRFLFPIMDARGQVIGLCGRATAEKLADGWAKYINSKGYDPESYNPDTDNILYHKSSTFYGWHQSAKAITNMEEVVILEGPTDVISLHEAGFENAVATGGTAFTKFHCSELERLRVPGINFFFDGDHAGISAAKNAVELAIQHGFTPSVTLCDVWQKGKFETWFKENIKEGDILALYELQGDREELVNQWPIEGEEILAKIGIEHQDLPTTNKYIFRSQNGKEHKLEAHDPDSLARSLSKADFKGFMRLKKQDGLVWLVMQEYDDIDPIKQAKAMETAAVLLSHLKDVNQRLSYFKAISQKERLNLDSKGKAHLEKEIGKLTKEKAPKKKFSDRLTDEMKMGRQYGIFIREDENVFYRYDGTGEGNDVPITNFIIRPQYLIRDKESPRRIIEIVNVYDSVAVLNLDAKVFGTMQKFVDEIIGYGNFVFEPWAKSLDFKMIANYVMDQMNDREAYQVIAMGWHRKGFYTWANAITDTKGHEYLPDKYGLVDFDGTKFLLPGSGVTDLDENYDLTEEENGHIRAFKYYKGEAISFKKWNEQLIKVHGDNGMMGTAYYMATLFSDAIYPRNNCFPLLNCFGKKGKGKTTLLYSLLYMFGDARMSGTLGVSTYTAFYRSFMQFSNAIIGWDEFHAKLDLKTWIKPMMSIWNRDGKAVGNIISSHSTSKTPIRGAFAYAGQDMPIQNDGALMSRGITLTFNYERSEEGDKALNELREIEQTGQLTKITADIIKHREKMEKLFDVKFSEVKNDVTDYLTQSLFDMTKVESRTLINHVIPLTVFKILENDYEFAFSYLDLVAFTSKLIEFQSEVVHGSDDTGKYLKAIMVMLDEKMIKHYHHVLVEMSDKVTIELSRSETDTIYFKDANGQREERKLMYLWNTTVYSKYEQFRAQRGGDVLDESTISHYIETHPAFLGKCKAKKFNPRDSARRCYVLDVKKMGALDFPLSVEVGGRDDELEDDGTGNVGFEPENVITNPKSGDEPPF